MGTSFDTVWSPTINVFLLIMRLFLEAGDISPCVWLPQMGSSILLVAFRGLLLPGPSQLPFRPRRLESTESLSLPMPAHCSDPLSHFLYSQGFILLFPFVFK